MIIRLWIELQDSDYCDGCLLLHSPGGGFLPKCLLDWPVALVRRAETGKDVSRPDGCKARNGR